MAAREFPWADPPEDRFLGDPNQVITIAETEISSANSYIMSLGTLTATLTPPVVTPDFPTGGAAPAVEVPTAPAVTSPIWVAPGVPTAFSDILEVDDLEVEPFDVDAPTLVYGAAPAAFNTPLPAEPTIDLVFDDPTLTVNLPAPPNLLSISVSAFDGMNLPVFSATEPTLDLVEPTIREYTPGALYTSSLLTSLKASLEQRITVGGTGLGASGETAIWERGREREAKSYEDAVRDLEQMESMGFQLPPGGYLDARLRLMRERDAQDRGHSREVMAKSAELELENVKHALATASDIEGKSMSYANQVEQRIFESCRYVTEAGVAIYNGKVQAFAALVDVYRAKVQAYEAQIRAETAKVDAYRAEIEAEKAKADVNTALVAQYKVQVDAALSSIEIYKAEIAGIQAKADIERTKIMVFGEQVRAYGAQVNAYTAGIEAYRAQLQGEQTKAMIYTAQVDAFKARVDASARQIEGRVAAFRGRIDAKNAEWEGYKAQSQGEAARVGAAAQVIGAQADIYRATVGGVSAFNETLTKQWQVALDQSQRVSEIAIGAAKVNAENYLTVRSLALDAAKVGATVSAQLGAAALNAVNWSSSISSSESSANSSSVSESLSSGYSKSYNENYNYSV